MASESDIRKMLIDALWPSIQDIVKQEISSLTDWRTELANATAAMRRELDELRKAISDELAARAAQVTKDVPRQVAQEIDGRLSALRQQLVLGATQLQALREEAGDGIAQLQQRVDALDFRLRGAAAALGEGSLPEPASMARTGSE
jgi:chromosome segregation ATPase